MPAPQPPATGMSGLSLAHFLAPAVTLGVSLLVGLGVFFSADAPDGFFVDRFMPYAALLAALAAAVGLLLSWNELDLSALGILALAGHIYFDMSDSNVAAAVLVSALAGLFVGTVIGVLRWLTRAPAGVLSLAGGVVASTFYVQLRDLGDPRGAISGLGTIDGPWVHILTAVVFVTVAVVLGALLGRPRSGGSEGHADSEPGLRVIAGFALSGVAAGVVGAVFLGWQSFGPPSQHWGVHASLWLLPIFAAVAIGGVLRGSWFIAPLGAASGAVAAALLNDGGRLHGWDVSTVELLLVGFLLGSLVVSYGLHRVLNGSVMGQTPAAPPPNQPVPF